MWNPHSYIAQAVGSKRKIINSVTLPSFYEYTTRLLLLEREEEHLRSKMADERVIWKMSRFSFCGKDYTAHYSIEQDTEQFVQEVGTIVKDISDAVIRCRSTYADFLEQLETFRTMCKDEEADFTFADNISVDNVYTREAYLSLELSRRLPVPATVSMLLIERESFHFVVKGDLCTIPVAAMIDGDGAPVRYEGVELGSETFSTSNGFCRQCKDVNGCCFVTVISEKGMGCAAALFSAETVVSDGHVEAVLRTLTDAGAIACFSCVYNDGTVYQYEQQGIDADSAAMAAATRYDAIAHRARVIRYSRNADAMHLLIDDTKKSVPRDVTAFDSALNPPTLVATMQAFSGRPYFEVVHRVAPIGLLSGSMLLSVERDSPLYNNVLKCGDKILLFLFADQDVWKKGCPRQWLVPAKCDAFKTSSGYFSVPRCSVVSIALLFSTERSFAVGDSAVVFGSVTDATLTEKAFSVPLSLPSSLFRYTPFVCKFLHRRYGPVGFVGYSFFFCSTTPLIATALFSLNVTDIISSEAVIEPTVELFFFRRDYGLFPEPVYPNFTEDLPFPLHQLTGEKASVVAGKVACRLLQMGLLVRESSVFVVLSVTRVTFDGSEVLQIA
ncbi:hypothetical protein, conserved [Leishmania lindenbergi]|uniref:Uncharacterized protein n=1 Tax=Leishmania lindenbergi TaxID=651832 RepID=A0AAW3AF85_9TRYP